MSEKKVPRPEIEAARKLIKPGEIPKGTHAWRVKEAYLAEQRKQGRRERKKCDATNNIDVRRKLVREMMACGEWRGIVSKLELAERFDVSLATIAGDAQEVSRQLRMNPEEAEAMRIASICYAEMIKRLVLEMRNKNTGLPDFRAALDANLQALVFAIGKNAVENPPPPASDEQRRVEVHVLPDPTAEPPKEPSS